MVFPSTRLINYLTDKSFHRQPTIGFVPHHLSSLDESARVSVPVSNEEHSTVLPLHLTESPSLSCVKTLRSSNRLSSLRVNGKILGPWYFRHLTSSPTDTSFLRRPTIGLVPSELSSLVDKPGVPAPVSNEEQFIIRLYIFSVFIIVLHQDLEICE